MTVLISGATGTTGSEVLRRLQAEGMPVRAMTRSNESAERLRAAGTETVVADLADSSSLAAALEGIDAIYVANPSTPAIAELEGNLARAAVAAGVGHLVKLSVIGAAENSPLEFGRLHAAAEREVLDSGIAWTMVRPNGFMQNTLAWAAQIPGGAVYGPVMDARWSIVDVRDIGAVAAAVLADPAAHAGRSYTVTGPEASSPREQIAIVSELLGRDIAAQEVSIEQAQQSMLDMGLPAWTVERLGELWRLYADGLAADVSGDVEQVTGTAPRGYREFAADHLAAFAG